MIDFNQEEGEKLPLRCSTGFQDKWKLYIIYGLEVGQRICFDKQEKYNGIIMESEIIWNVSKVARGQNICCKVT
jgi:hypothetical protein